MVELSPMVVPMPGENKQMSFNRFVIRISSQRAKWQSFILRLIAAGSWRFRDPDVTMLNVPSHASPSGARVDCSGLLIGQSLWQSVLSFAVTFDPHPPLVANQSIISMQAAYFCQPNKAFKSFNEKLGIPELHNVPWYLKPRLLRTSLIPVKFQISFLLEPTVLKSLSPLSEYLNSKVRPRLNNWMYLIRILWMDFHSLFNSIG